MALTEFGANVLLGLLATVIVVLICLPPKWDPAIRWKERNERRLINERLGPDDPSCSHSHFDPSKHGRRCTCGTLMFDPGD